MVGGAISSAMGGNFWQGFTSAAVAAGVSLAAAEAAGEIRKAQLWKAAKGALAKLEDEMLQAPSSQGGGKQYVPGVMLAGSSHGSFRPYLSQGQVVDKSANAWSWKYETPLNVFASKWEVSWDLELGKEEGTFSLDIGIGTERTIYVQAFQARWVSNPGTYYPMNGTVITEMYDVLYRVATQGYDSFLGVPFKWTTYEPISIGGYSAQSIVKAYCGSPWNLPSTSLPPDLPVANQWRVLW
jgi:hypothetical protein